MSRRITTDAGHGGYDGGASKNGYLEKDITLKICLDVNERLRQHGIEVSTTRNSDVFIPLGKRSDIANSNNSEAFLSFHVNSASNDSAEGLETFHHPSSVEGKRLATMVQQELVDAKLCQANRGVKSANFSVLRRTKMPSALVELFFINNKSDLDFFLGNYDDFVEAITRALVKYVGVEYKPHNQEIEAPQEPSINIVDGKVNLLLISKHVAVDGFAKDGVTYVDVNGSHLAIREILENMGLIVEWNQDLGLITADTRGDYKTPSNSIKINLLGSLIDVRVHLHKGQYCLKLDSAYVPIRDIFESLGFSVGYEVNSKTITIS